MGAPLVSARRDGPVLYASWASPPSRSGSAHVVIELETADRRGALAFAGATPLLQPEPQTECRRLHSIRSDLLRDGRGDRWLWPLKLLTFPWLVASLAWIVHRERPRGIVAVFPDAFWSVACLLVARLSGRPLATYFHNGYSWNRQGLGRAWATAVERRMLAASETVLFISETLKDGYAQRYPEHAWRFDVLRHPVAPNAFEPAPVDPARAAGPETVVTLIGTLNDSNLDATVRSIEAIAGEPGVRIDVITHSRVEFLLRAGFPFGKVNFLGYLGADELDARLRATDVFLLPHGLSGSFSTEEYLSIMPTRLTTYLKYGRPVFAHVPADSEVQRFLDAHRCAVVVTRADVDEVREAFRAMRSDGQRQHALGAAALTASAQFDPRRVIDRLVSAVQPIRRVVAAPCPLSRRDPSA